MTDVAGLVAKLSLDIAGFASGAERAQQVMQRTMAGIQQDANRSAQSLSVLTTGMKSLATGFVAGFGVTAITAGITQFGSAVVQAGDQVQQLRARLTQSIGTDAFELAEASAQKLGVSIETVSGTMSRLGQALHGVGASALEIQQMTETLTRMGQVSGATAEEIRSALTQFSQGFASGRLQGDELRTVLEALPPLAVALADELGVTVGELRDLGAEGAITGDIMRKALGGAFDEFEQKAAALPGTVEQATIKMRNSFGKLLAAIDQVTGASEKLKHVYDTIGRGAEGLAAIVGGVQPPTSRHEQQLQLTKELIEAEKQLALMQRQATELAAPITDELQAQQKVVDDLRASIKSIDDAIQSAAQRAEASKGWGSFETLKRSAEGIEGVKENIDGLHERLGIFHDAIIQVGEDTVRTAAKSSEHAQQVADAAAREAEERLKSMEVLRNQADAAEALAEVAGKGAAAEKLVRIELEKQEKLRRAALELSGEQLRIASQDIERGASAEIKVVGVEEQERAYKELWEASQKGYQEYLDIVEANTKESADRQTDILMQPWVELAGSVPKIMDDLFYDILTGAEGLDFSSIGKSIGQTFARAISGTLATIITKPLTDIIAQAATDGLSKAMAGAGGPGTTAGGARFGGLLPPAGQSASFGQYLGMASIGGAAGGLMGAGYSQFAGLKPGNQAALGGAIGGAAGAVIGTMIMPGIGTAIGTALGGAGGSFLGGMFGGQNNLGNDRSAQVFNLRRGLRYSDVSFSQENRQITQGIIDELSTLQQALEGIGASFERFNLRIEAGTKTGITVNGKTYASAQDALRGSIEAMLGGTTGLTGIQQQILQTTQAGTAQGVLADVQFGKTYEELIGKGTELDRALATLNQTFAQAGRKAAELGLDVNALAEAHQREAIAVVQEFQARQQAFRAQLQTLAPTPGGEGISAQFSALDQQFAELGRSARELGVPIEEVAAAHQRATANLTASIQQQQRDLSLQLRSAGAGGPAVIEAQFSQLDAQFEELGRSAMRLSIPLDEVTAAHQRAAQQLSQNIELQQRQVQGQIAVAGGAQDLGTQLFLIETSMRELLQTTIAAGFSAADALNAVTQAHRAANIAAVEAWWQRQRNLVDQLYSVMGDNSINAQLHALETRMRELGKEAVLLGHPLSNITRAHQVAANNIINANNQLRASFRTEVAGIAPGGRPVDVEFAQLSIRMQELRKRAVELGESLGQVDAAQARETAQILARHTRESIAFGQELQSISPTGNALQREVTLLGVRFDELRQRARDLGVSIAEVNAAQIRAQQEAVREYMQSQTDFLQELENIAPSGNALELTLRSIESRFVELRKRASELQIPLAGVAAAQARAVAEARRQQEQQRTQFQQDLEGIAPTGSSLTRELRELDIRFADLRQRAIELGVALSQVDAAQARSRAEIIERNRQAQYAFLTELQGIMPAPGANRLVYEFNQIQVQFDQLRERAKELGLALGQVNAAQQYAQQQAQQRFIQEQNALMQELEGIAPTGQQLALSLKQIDYQFVELRKRATDLAVPLNMVEDAYRRAKEEAKRQYEERRAELLIQVQNLGAVGLTKTLNDIRDQFRDLRKELDAVGLATVDLTAKQREAELRAIGEAERQVASLEQQAAEQQRGIRDFFESLMAPLRAANQNVLAPIAQIEAARRRFAETAALARQGDLEALRDLAGVTQELMGLRERFLSSGGLGADILAQVQAGTQGIVAGLEQQQREAMASVPDVIRETTSEHIRVLIAENAKTLEELQALRREIANNRLKAA